MTKLKTRWASVLVGQLVALSISTSACTELDGGFHDGTETGNPPVAAPALNEALVALVVTADQVRVTGQPEAATPGAQVEVTSALTGQVFAGMVAADGSFDVAVEGSSLDTFEVRVVASGKQSATVYVVPGAAAVTGTTGSSLSCEQRQTLSRQQLDAVASTVDRHCRIDTDCTTVTSGSACSDSCSVYPVSKIGAMDVDAARSAIEGGLCKSFLADGCKNILLPCLPPQGELACVRGQCALANPIEAPAPLGCQEPFDLGTGDANLEVYWYSASAEACLPRRYSGVGGNQNRYTSRAACETACPSDWSSCATGLTPREVCISGGLGGGCAESAMACARPCTSMAQCEGDPIGSWCAGGFCDSTSPL